MAEESTTTGAGFAPSLKGRLASLINFLKTEKGIAIALLLLAILFNAVFLWSEVGVPTFGLNDEVPHLTATQEASAVLHQGLDPTDFWLYLHDLGSPFFHDYQHLPQVVLAVIDQGTSFFLPLPQLFDISRYLLLVFFPLSVFWAMRRFDFDWLAAGFSALVASLLSTNGLYGFDYFSYIWAGWGLYTQLWAMFFLPLALAEIYRTIRKEGSWFWPVLLSSIVFLSSLVYAPILVVSTATFIFLKPDRAEIFSRFKRWAGIFILTGLVTLYFVASIILDRAYIVQSNIFGKPTIFDSYGATEVLKMLFTGNLFDYGRLPVLTLLFFLALIAVIWQWKKENHRLVVVLTLLWLVLYFGPFWGHLFDGIPFSGNLEFARFIGGFHMGAILLTGAGLSLILQWSKKFIIQIPSLRLPSFKASLLVGIAFLLVLTPAFLGCAAFYQENAQWKTATQNAFLIKNNEIAEIKETLDSLPPGRVYAGLYSDFGNYPYYKIGSVPLYAVLPRLGFDTFGYSYTGLDLSNNIRLHFDNKKQEEYNLFNIRYVILHNTWTAPYYYSPIKKFDDYTLYQVPTTGYFDLVDVPAVFYGNTTGFYYPNYAWFSSALPQQKQHPVIEIGTKPENTYGLPVFSYEEVDAANLSSLSRVQPAGGEILNETVSTNEYRAQFAVSRDCYLMLKTNYHPGWVVTLDGKKVSPVMLAPGFIGIEVGPGTHQAVFTYQPPFYRLPLIIVGVLILILLGLYQWRKFPQKKYSEVAR